MSLFAFILIVTSATFHASWNLLAKKNQITLPFLAILCVVSALLSTNIFFWTPVLAGIFASLTYGLIIIAMNYVDNVSYIQVFRQLGLLLGMGGAIIFLKEKVTVPKVIGGISVVTGLILSVLKI